MKRRGEKTYTKSRESKRNTTSFFIFSNHHQHHEQTQPPPNHIITTPLSTSFTSSNHHLQTKHNNYKITTIRNKDETRTLKISQKLH
jgi:hypothetical protein